MLLNQTILWTKKIKIEKERNSNPDQHGPNGFSPRLLHLAQDTAICLGFLPRTRRCSAGLLRKSFLGVIALWVAFFPFVPMDLPTGFGGKLAALLGNHVSRWTLEDQSEKFPCGLRTNGLTRKRTLIFNDLRKPFSQNVGRVLRTGTYTAHEVVSRTGAHGSDFRPGSKMKHQALTVVSRRACRAENWSDLEIDFMKMSGRRAPHCVRY